MSFEFTQVLKDRITLRPFQHCHRTDLNQGSDYIAILLFPDFKFYVTKAENLKHAFVGELIFLPS